MTFERVDLSPDVTLYRGDCLEVLPTLAAGSIDAVVTDPPYGCGKADWDASFPTAWYEAARAVAPTIVIITGSAGLADSVPLVGADFVDVVAGWNTNGMTRGPLGFGNWLSAVVAGQRPRTKMGPNVIRFSVSGTMPPHPSPKPLEYMRMLVERITLSDDLILDPFMGSGTTGVACVQTGRKFVGIEIDPGYFAIAEKRIREALMQPRLL